MSESQKPPQHSTQDPPQGPVPDPSKKPDRAQIPPPSKYAWTMFIFHPIRSKKQ